MSDMPYILSIDQGTSSTKTIIVDELGNIFCKATEPLKTFYLENGFVEQDPEDIYQNVLQSVAKCIRAFEEKGCSVAEIRSCGISNQRETFVIWDKAGAPLYNAVVWQCKRSIFVCDKWKKSNLQEVIRAKTGLMIDPYFSGSKVAWLLENNEAIRSKIENGDAYFGTVDTWLLYKLTGGAQYYTDYTNASRTMFFNLSALTWDNELLNTFGLSRLNLPHCKPSSFHFGETKFNGLLENAIPITGMIGDSHAAAFGEGCFEPGNAKATMGTGCSILLNIGKEINHSTSGMVTTICWSTEKEVHYALEGVIVSCGATIEWLKNELGLFSDSQETEAMARSVSDNGGVYLIPAFSGLGAPYWEMSRKASISGITFGTTKNHIVRAALESVAYQIKDVITAMESDTHVHLKELMIDGGITSNAFIVQFLADLLQKPVVNIGTSDVSALGAAFLSGLKSGVFKSLEQLRDLKNEKSVKPSPNEKIQNYYSEWKNSISSNR